MLSWRELVAAWTRLMAAEPPWIWLVALLVAVGVGLIGELLLRGLFRVIRAVARRTATQSDDHLLLRVRLPARVLVASCSLHIAVTLANLSWADPALTLIEWLLATFLIVESVDALVVDFVMAERLGLRVPPLLRQVAIGVVYLGVVLVVLGHVSGMDITPLLATTSVVSLVLGFALQQPLSNFFAGLVLAIDRPFREGEWILVNQRDGRVEHVGWRATRLSTLSGDVLVVPNFALLTADIVNFSQPERRTSRLVELPCPLSVPPAELARWVTEVVEGIPGCLSDPPPKIWLTRIETHFLRYTIKMWVEDYRLHDDLESELLKGMWYRFEAEGVPLAMALPVRITEEP